MIRRLDLSSFGSFSDFAWASSVTDEMGNSLVFCKYNIIYGRNYSGKTTLSRAFRALETGVLPEHYDSPSFRIILDSESFNETSIPCSTANLRVYNEDFIKDNLEFLRTGSGDISPFTVLGQQNKEIRDEIRSLEEKIGSDENGSGLTSQLNEKKTNLLRDSATLSSAEQELTRLMKNKATGGPESIKYSDFLNEPNYSIPKLKDDIQWVKDNNFVALSVSERQELEKRAQETELPEISNTFSFSYELEPLYKEANELLVARITPTKAINELLENRQLQTWVEQGLNLHRDKKKDCGFCGQALPDEFWKRMDSHFNQQSNALKQKIQTQIGKVEAEQRKLEAAINISERDFYTEFQSEFKDSIKVLSREISAFKTNLENLRIQLASRLGDIFNPKNAVNFLVDSEATRDSVETVMRLIKENNQYTSTLKESKKDARIALRRNEVAKFMSDIEYDKKLTHIEELRAAKTKTENEKLDVDEKINEIRSRIETLQNRMSNEGAAAAKISNILNQHFGHEGLKLVASKTGASDGKIFQILRDNKPASNLSEGECSLIAFCYFVAKLEDQDSVGKEQIIYIDDPISSLDSNHIFFIFSLLCKLIERTNTVQLFVSTHNLEFLKFLKRLPIRNKEHDLQHFLISNKQGVSHIEIMPAYLRDYVTELNFLFAEIATCSNPKNATSQYHCFYNFPNNLRKFLEAYLFFRFPKGTSSKSHDKKIRKFFGDDTGSDLYVQRLTNEYSHLVWVDRAQQPIDREDISKMAQFVLSKIKSNDHDQYKCFLDSVNMADPLPVQAETTADTIA